MTTRDEELDRILGEIENAKTGDLRLRISGEAVSRQLEQLKTVPPDSEEAGRITNRLLLLTQHHSLFLIDSGLYNEAMGLMTGVLAAVLTMRINPENVPDAYLNFLMGCIAMCDRTIHEVYGGQETPETLHLQAILINFVQLFLATFERFKNFKGVADFQQFAESLELEISDMSEEERQFDGKPIVPQMAIDIAYDALERLNACGLISMEDL